MKAMTIYFDDDAGELTRIVQAPEFKRSSALLRADVLKDVIGVLSTDYEAAINEALPEMAAHTVPGTRAR